MAEQPQSECDRRHSKAFMRLTAWLFLASLVLAATLPFTNRRGWTHDAPWGPPTFIAALAVYGWLLARWDRWGEWRRTSGRRSLFGAHSHVGSTAESHFWLFHTVCSGIACLAGGAISREAAFTLLPIIFVPLMLPSIMGFALTAQGDSLFQLISRFLAIFIGMPGFVLLTHTFTHSTHPLTLSRFGFKVALSLIGIALLAIMVSWQAQLAWQDAQRAESNTT